MLDNKIFNYKKVIKNTIAMLLVFVMIFNITGCSKRENKKVGHGKEGVIEAFDWSGYDTLIEECKKENNQQIRNQKMFEAENMLLDSGAVIPLSTGTDKYLCRESLDNFYISCSGTPIAKFATPKDGRKELNVCICTEPGSFDPVQAATLDTATVVENYTGNLFHSTETGVEPELAQDLQISADGMTYTVKIKPEAKWSDGVDVKAADFEYTWKRAAKEETGAEYGFMYDPIEGYPDNLNVSALDDKTLQVKLKAPCPYFKSLMAHSSYAPTRQDIVESAPNYKDNVFDWGTNVPKVTCGAFSVESWKHNSSIILKKNPGYVFADKVMVDKMHLMLSADEPSVFAAYESGNIDVNYRLIPSDEIDHVKGRADYHNKKSQSCNYFYFNVNNDIFKGMTADEAKKFRKAIGYTIDRTFIVKTVQVAENLEEGRIVPSTVHDGTSNLFADSIKSMTGSPVEYTGQPKFDVARQMLQEIGFTFDKDGKIEQDITLEYTYNTVDANTSIATCLQADFAELGIKLITRSLDWNVFIKERMQGKFETARGSWSPDFDDPMTFLDMFTTNNSMNDVGLGKIK